MNLGEDQLKSNRFVPPGLGPTIPKKNINIWLAVLSNPVIRQTNRQKWKK